MHYLCQFTKIFFSYCTLLTHTTPYTEYHCRVNTTSHQFLTMKTEVWNKTEFHLVCVMYMYSSAVLHGREAPAASMTVFLIIKQATSKTTFHEIYFVDYWFDKNKTNITKRLKIYFLITKYQDHVAC